MDFESGDGWDSLCHFLGQPVPDRPFPHANQQSYDLSDAELMRRMTRFKQRLRAQSTTGTRHLALSARSLGPLHCVRCGLHLSRGAEEAPGLAGRLPSWAKEAYRSLHRRVFVPNQGPRESEPRVRSLRRDHPALTIDDMAVVTCFYNPCGYRSRVENYRHFRRALDACGLPVLTVEMALGNDPFYLDADAGEVLTLRAPQPMWQKERLLNIGIRELLARGYRKIVWLDADIVFDDRAHWPWHVAAALERYATCQVFGQVLVEQEGGRKLIPGVSALRYHCEAGSWLFQRRRGPTLRRLAGYPLGYSGYGWAARAEVLEEVELYDRAVVGGGDMLIYAASGHLDKGWQRQVSKLITSSLGPCGSCGHINHASGYLADYFAWAVRWNRAVGGRAGWTDRTIRSLYHGNRQDRHYALRRDILLRHDYDPAVDLTQAASGCWQWSSNKPALHLDVQNYFFERREDS